MFYKKYDNGQWCRCNHQLIKLICFGCLGMILSFRLIAQDDIEADEDVYSLSPFVVEGSSELGYLATNTLAGTRINTELKDLPNSIAVATAELMNDLNVTDAAQLLPYMGNIETAGADGSYGGGTGTATILYTDASRNPESANRVRGLASADNTRNYLPTAILFDSYNTESVTVNRGPNSILFGLGSPGGIIDNQIISPNFEDASKLSVQYSSFNSVRGQFDLNREILEDKLAIRVAAVAEDKYWRQTPTFSRTKRATVALRWRPFKNANLRVNYERGEIDSRKPRPNAPRDTFTRWWHPAFNKVTHSPGYEEFGTIDRDIVRAPGEWFAQPGVIFEGQTGEVLWMQRAWETSKVDGKNFRNNMVSITKGQQWYQSATAAQYGIERGAFWGDEELLDRDVFDWVENLLDGPNKGEWERFHVFNLSYDQNWRFSLGSVGYEMTYGNETVNRNWYDAFQGHRGYNISIDINTTTNWGDPNPNFGRPFLASTDNRFSGYQDREISRATAYYDLDFKSSERGWMKWLGHHTGTFFGQTYMLDRRDFTARSRLTQDYANVVLGGDTDLYQEATEARNVVYIGDSFADAASPRDGNIYRIQTELYADSVTAHFWNTDTMQWDTTVAHPQNVREDETFWNNVYSKTYNRQITESYAYVHQLYLFDTEWIVGTFGYRKDKVKSYGSNTPRTEHDFIDVDAIELDDELASDPFEAITRSYGVVVHSPEFLPLPKGVNLSLHWGESENFQIAAPRMSVFGDLIDPPGGKTKDYGFTVGLFNQKLLIRTNFYDSKSSGVSKSYPHWLFNMDRTIIQYNSPEAIAASGYQGPPQFYKDLTNWQIVEESSSPSGYTVQQNATPFALADTESTASEGVEIDITYNPTKNWRISWNISKQEAMLSDIGPGTRKYLEYRVGDWLSTTPGGPGFLIADESDQPVNVRIYDTLMNSLNADLARDGTKVSELREWRSNLITNYKFGQDSSLKHFNVGGALRWQDEKAIGYPIIDKEFDGQILEVPDLEHPYTDDPITQVDLWVGYSRKIMNGKVNWNLQLNLRNVLSDGEVIAAAAQPDGSTQSAIWREGRTFSLRSVFEF